MSPPTTTGHRCRAPWALGLSLAAAAVFASETVTCWLQLDRSAGAAQVWRFLTCHLTHWNADHLAWDLGTFTLLAVLCERRDRRRFLGCTLGAAIAISTAFWLLLPALPIYRGLSGLDSALFVLLAGLMLREQRDAGDRVGVAVITLLLAAFLGKVTWEIVTGQTIFVASSAGGFEPVPLAHIVGGVAGILAALPGSWTQSAAGGPARSRRPRMRRYPVSTFAPRSPVRNQSSQSIVPGSR